jgi:hypothetical protein
MSICLSNTAHQPIGDQPNDFSVAGIYFKPRRLAYGKDSILCKAKRIYKIHLNFERSLEAFDRGVVKIVN